MSYPIKQSSTQAPLLFFMTLSSDHITGATGLSPTVTISKAGGSFASPSGTVSEIANGWYKVAGNATDTGTLGPIALHATAATADPCDLIAGMVVAYDPQDAVHLGLSALPNTACTTNASLLTSGTGTDQLSVSAGKVLLQATQTGVTIPTVTTVTNQLTAAAIATGVWQDTTSGDFTVASSIGKSLYTSGNAPGAASGIALVGSNMGTVSSVTGSVGSVTGAVGSVASGGISRASFTADSGLQSVRSNTAAAGASTTITLDASASATDNFYRGSLIYLTGGTGAGQYRLCTGYVGSTKVATIVPAWVTNPDNTTTFAIEAAGMVDVESILFTASVGAAGYVGVDWGHVNAPTTTVNLSGTTVGTLTTYTGNTPQTGDSFARIGSTGSGLTSLAPASTALSTATWTGTLATNLGTLASHDPGATIGTSTLTQTQVTGGAYALNSASFAFNSAFDFTSTQKTSIGTAVAASAVASVTGNVGGNVTGSVGSIASGGITRASFAADTGLQTIRSNTAQAGGSTSITLDAGASATDSYYVNDLIFLTGGTGAGQSRFITAYVGSTKVATVDAWTTNPDNTTTFAILPFDSIPGATAPTAAQNATAVWTDLLSGSDFSTSGSIGALLKLAIPAVAPGGDGGLFVSGTNDHCTITNNLLVSGTTTFTGAVAANGGVTFTSSSGVGFVISTTHSGSAGMTVTGNGAADGLTITSGSGATGNAMTLTCSTTNGDGFHCVGSGSGNGIYGQTGTTGSGMLLVGTAGLKAQGTGVAGIYAISTSLSGAGIRAQANGTGSDILLVTSGTIVNSSTGGAVAKVDIQTIKTQTVTCGAGVTINPSVGAANELLVDGSGFVTFNNTTLSGSVGSVIGTVGGIAGTTQTLDALQTALSSTHGAGSWVTATGFATPADVSDSTAAIEAHGDAAWSTATGFAVPGDAMTLTSGGYTAAADALLGRNIAGGSSAGRTVSEALFALRNKVAIATGTMTVYSTDDTTTAWTAAVATDNTADPIVSVDPS